MSVHGTQIKNSLDGCELFVAHHFEKATIEVPTQATLESMSNVFLSDAEAELKALQS